MFRPAFRTAVIARSIPKAPTGRRFASSTTRRTGTWKGAALRWTAAGAIVYYYNTSTIFADEPHRAPHAAPLDTTSGSETYSTVDSIAEQRRAQARSQLEASQASPVPASQTPNNGEQPANGGPEALEEEAEQQGAFNEETGEINWDCPCLGGMAHGPCGEQFRAAFSCFVFSKEEPKGVDCIEHFKTMQNCFREHPDIYGAELDDDEVAEVQAEEERARSAQSGEPQSAAAGAQGGQEVLLKEEIKKDILDAKDELTSKASIAKDELVSKASEAKDEFVDKVTK
ncbi:related to Mitochondrial intermembrane space import and assembly protein 40 [Ramularia collo-cygni]|uniref:Mitochondrial intermembrane space import and assembly protein 40 n=1 Tax=Ramularia collo-cygni TaxID=112498 RepID=A0A2D3VJP8_9PEZI|nr:related to Mitochondrial intermembrane space import and assembly protein 40 [Ramularia collo-cygni]CZT23539.1 related to Mitochondrial intermembrane space import and assembly protein 40 [Ramularia collo-cygni]